jgi:hypothetical protein
MRPNERGCPAQDQKRRKKPDAETSARSPIMATPDQEINHHKGSHLRLDRGERHDYARKQKTFSLHSEKRQCEQKSDE